jgi:hypothetical protein
MATLSSPYRELYERLARELFAPGDGEAPVLLQWVAQEGDPPLSPGHPELRDLRQPFDNGHVYNGERWPLRVAQKTFLAWRDAQIGVAPELQEPPWHLPVLAAMVGILGQERNFFSVYPRLCEVLGCRFDGNELSRLEVPSWNTLWSSFEDWSVAAQSRGRFRLLEAGPPAHIYVRLLRGQMVATSPEVRELVRVLGRQGFDAIDPPSIDEVLSVARRLPLRSAQLQMTLDHRPRQELLQELVAKHMIAGSRSVAQEGKQGQVDGMLPRLRRVVFRGRGCIEGCCWRVEMPQPATTVFEIQGTAYRIGGSSWELEKDSGNGHWTTVCAFRSHVEHPESFPLFRERAEVGALCGRFSYPARSARVFVQEDLDWIEVPRPFSDSKRAILMFDSAGMPRFADVGAVQQIPVSTQLRAALGERFASVEFLDVDLDRLPDELRNCPVIGERLRPAAAQDMPSDFIDCDTGILVSRSPRTYLSYFLPRRKPDVAGGRGDFLVTQESRGAIRMKLPNGSGISIEFSTPEVLVRRSDDQQPESAIEVQTIGDPLQGKFSPLLDVLPPVLPSLALLQAIPSRSPASKEYWDGKAIEFVERLGAGGDIKERSRRALIFASARGHIDISSVDGRAGKTVSACAPELVLTAIPAHEPGHRIGWLRGGWDWLKLAREPVSPAAAALGWMVNPEAVDDVAQVLVSGTPEQFTAFAQERGVRLCSRMPIGFEVPSMEAEQCLVDGRDIADDSYEFFNPYWPDKPIRIRPMFREEDHRSIHKLFGKGQIFLYRDLPADGEPARPWRSGCTNHAAGWQGGPELAFEQAMACRLDIFKAAWARIAEIGFHGTPGAPFSGKHGYLSFPRELRLPPSISRVLYACSGGTLALSGRTSSQLSSALREGRAPSGPVCPDGKLRTFARIPHNVAAHVVKQLGWALAVQED